ncbi:MAG: phosphopantetheine-binding protein [Myxococcota bacterium]
MAQAVAFGVPHPELGEDLAAAVVLRAPGRARASSSCASTSRRASPTSRCRGAVLLETIPTGPTGKLQRIGLAERPASPPRSRARRRRRRRARDGHDADRGDRRAGLGRGGRPAPGLRRSFFAQGGDSLAALRWVARIKDLLAVELPLLSVFDAPTVAAVAALVDGQLDAQLGPAA